MRISEIFLLENLSINVPYHRLTMFRASKINMALARMDKLVKKLMLNPDLSISILSTNV
jgi:fatty-acid desaturase